MQNNNGELVLDYYEKYLGYYKSIKRYSDEKSILQFLQYDGIISGCDTVATLGVSKYISSELTTEAIMIVDDEFEKSQEVLANALFFIIQNNIELMPGTYIEGVANINREFEEDIDKSAIYFTSPFCFPEDFYSDNNFLLAFFITSEEVQYIKENGAEAFEDYLERSGCDIFSIRRKK